jgi:hypothetical protein
MKLQTTGLKIQEPRKEKSLIFYWIEQKMKFITW